MCKKHLTLLAVAFIAIPLLMGCGIKNAFFKPEVPPLEDYSTIVFAPFDFEKEPQEDEYQNLPTMISYSIGTKLGVRFEDKNWFYDQSQEMTPVTDKLKELNISARDTYLNNQSAIELGKAFNADLIVVGEMEKPKFTMEESGKIEEDKSVTTPTGAARYYSIHQSALLPVNVKIIDVNTGQQIWAGRIVGFKRYKTRYRTGNPKSFQREETMLADVRRELVENFVSRLYPVQEA
jgi:hypothetical protein